MEKLLKHLQGLQGFIFSTLFVFLGIYLFTIKESMFAKISGIACIVFFGGLMIWAISQKIKKGKLEK